MSNEDKILFLLTKMQSDIENLKADVETLKFDKRVPSEEKKKLTAEERFALFDAMAALLTQEEKDALGKYMEAEEARKAALYG